ncbi:D-alanyl-D-alanine carboxypeptidase family protein [Clostridium sediminicola]|uniref:D-alanyl-D-alanine carboxypeptidase family protein n=1 Tax=Clostridium sediminicola TaxID=3114879 RepID=UPI0031F265A0
MRQKILSLFITLAILLSFSMPVFAENATLPQIQGESAIVIDVQSGEIIYAKNADKTPMYPASITKLLTAILLADNSQPTDIIEYTKEAAKEPAYSLYNIIPVKVGDKMNADNLMKALMIYSANDSAVMVANHVSGTKSDFITLMNEKASELGLKNSSFATANGLDKNTNNHYTTAYDISILLRAAYENNWIKETMKMPSSKIAMTNGNSATEPNRNKLIGKTLSKDYLNELGIKLGEETASNAICVGGKTGLTNKAGRCLTAMFEKDGRLLVGVVLNSVYDSEDLTVFKDMAKIINWSYGATKDTFKVNNVEYKNNATIKNVELNYKPLFFIGPQKSVTLPLVIKENITFYNNEINTAEITETFNIGEINPWSLNKDSSVGTLTINQRELTNSYELYPTISTNDIIMSNKFIYVGVAIGLLFIFILLIFLIRSAISKKDRKRRKYRY